MKRSQHVLALFPLMAMLAMSPSELKIKHIHRGIASEPEQQQQAEQKTPSKVSETPKYDERAEKLDKSKLPVNADLDKAGFLSAADDYMSRLSQERKDYKIELKSKEEMGKQKDRVDGLVKDLVTLEGSLKAIKDKGTIVKEDQAAIDDHVAELKKTLESILCDEHENDVLAIQEEQRLQPKEQVPQAPKEEAVAAAPKEEKTPAPAKEEPKKDTDKICELEEKNKALTKQIEDLVAEQKKIMETMLGAMNMMLQVAQRQSQQQPNYTTSPLVSQQVLYTSTPTQAAGAWVYYPGGFNPQQMQIPQMQVPQMLTYQQAQPQMGQQAYQQQQISGQYDLRYAAPQDHTPTTFGAPDPFFYNFSTPGASLQAGAGTGALNGFNFRS